MVCCCMYITWYTINWHPNQNRQNQHCLLSGSNKIRSLISSNIDKNNENFKWSLQHNQLNFSRNDGRRNETIIVIVVSDDDAAAADDVTEGQHGAGGSGASEASPHQVLTDTARWAGARVLSVTLPGRVRPWGAGSTHRTHWVTCAGEHALGRHSIIFYCRYFSFNDFLAFCAKIENYVYVLGGDSVLCMSKLDDVMYIKWHDTHTSHTEWKRLKITYLFSNKMYRSRQCTQHVRKVLKSLPMIRQNVINLFLTILG